MNQHRINANILLVLIGALGSCSEPPAGIKVGPAARLDIVSGDAQSAVVGTELSQPLVARVEDANGNPVVGQVVNFHVTKGNGSVFAGSASTNANGIVQERWTLGTSTADRQVIEARAVDSNTGAPLVFGVFTAIALAGPGASVAANAGNDQFAQIGTAVIVPPSVKVLDSYGNPVPNFAVTFSVTLGGGAIAGATPKSDMAGIATVGGWTMGSEAGVNALTGGASGLTGSPVSFTASATPTAATTMAMAGGDGQSAMVGASVRIPPSVKLTDAHGNGIAGVDVTFAVQNGAGSITGANAVTGDGGLASVGSWTLGLSGVTNSITASSPFVNGSPVTFYATPLIQPGRIDIVDGDNQRATAGTAVTVRPSVKATDASGNPVLGATVTFTVMYGGGSITGGTVTTDANGIAAVGSWILGTRPGFNQLFVTAPNFAMTSFSAYGL
jgi:adhesin/invasin